MLQQLSTKQQVFQRVCHSPTGGTAAAAPPPSGLATLPSVGAVP